MMMMISDPVNLFSDSHGREEECAGRGRRMELSIWGGTDRPPTQCVMFVDLYYLMRVTIIIIIIMGAGQFGGVCLVGWLFVDGEARSKWNFGHFK